MGKQHMNSQSPPGRVLLAGSSSSWSLKLLSRPRADGGRYACFEAENVPENPNFQFSLKGKNKFATM
jgi:hypothetical protein